MKGREGERQRKEGERESACMPQLSIQRSEDILWESVLPFCHMDSRKVIKVFILTGKFIHPLGLLFNSGHCSGFCCRPLVQGDFILKLAKLKDVSNML